MAHYSVLEKIGQGGMGAVYAAKDTRLGRTVAVKVLLPEFVSSAERLQRFQREAMAVAALNHHNIVTVYSVEESDGYHFFTMELIHGQTLRHRISDRGLALHEFFEIAIPLADALHAAHKGGVTHRDVKPDNVMISDSGVLKILDFGLAKLAYDPADVRETERVITQALTGGGRIMGTAPYMAPEQLQAKPLDHRCDIFSLGVVLYELATGCRPFKGGTCAELITSILRDPPIPVCDRNPAAPVELGRIIEGCLRKRLRRRIQTARDVCSRLTELKKQLDSKWPQPPQPSPPEPTPPSGTTARSMASALSRLMHTRWGLSLLLVVVMGVNWVETAIEDALRTNHQVGVELAQELGSVAHWMEGSFQFEHHDMTNMVAVYGYSASYFFLLPLLLVGIGLALALRKDISPFRVFCLSVSADYALSLPFFVFLPVPERWTLPESGAMLLSDLWSSNLIEAMRPISSVDNCFPSFHVSLTVVLILLCFVHRFRLRYAVAALGATIILSTLVLGIHWGADVVAGAAIGTLSVAIACWKDRKLSARAERHYSLTYALSAGSP